MLIETEQNIRRTEKSLMPVAEEDSDDEKKTGNKPDINSGIRMGGADAHKRVSREPLEV